MRGVLWDLFELLINVYEGFIIFHFVCSFMEFNFRKRKNRIAFLIGSLGFAVVVTMINAISSFEGIMGLVYPLFVFLFAVIFIEGNIVKKFFVSLLAFLCIIMVNTIVTAVLSMAAENHLKSIYTERTIYRFIMIVTVQTVVTYLYQLILRILAKNRVTLKLSEWILIFSLLGISIVIFILIHLVQIQIVLTEQCILYLLAAKTGMLIINVVCFFMISKLSISNVTETENKILRQQNEYQKLYAENIQKQYDEIHYIRHDVNQHYNVLLSLIDNNKTDEAADYIKRVMTENIKADVSVDTGNDVVNAVLNSKLALASKNRINVVCSVSSDFSGIEDIDWCSLLGNLLDNAIEACGRCSCDTFIELQIRSDEDRIDITVKNSSEAIKTDGKNNLLTSKKNSGEHGYGTKIIKNIIKKYNGHYDFYMEDKVFYNSIVLHRKGK